MVYAEEIGSETMKRVIVCIALLGFVVIPFVLSAQPFMYVPSGDANDIIIIDLSTDQISGRINELEGEEVCG